MSSIWFPVHERITAQAIASVSTFLGAVAAFILGPMITVDNTKNDVKSTQERIMTLYYVEASIALFTLICSLIYFPNEPTYPPTLSAALKRRQKNRNNNTQMMYHDPQEVEEEQSSIRKEDNTIYRKTWLEYLSNNKIKRFLYLNIAISLPLGLYQAWSSVLDLNLQEFGITTIESAWIGCWMTLSGCLASIIVARYMDRFNGILKTCCVVSLLLASLFLFWFNELLKTTDGNSDQSDDVDRQSRIAWLYFTIICTGFFVNISIPLQFELVVETVYGIMSESMALAICTITNTILQIIFLALPTKIDGSSIWMNWTSLCAVIICVVMMILYQVDYTRLKLDTTHLIKQEDGGEMGEAEDDESGRRSDVDDDNDDIGFWFDRFGYI